MSWGKVGLFTLALCIAGIIGYRFGSDNSTERFIKQSEILIPIVVDYAIERYKEAPAIESLAESNKELIKTESLGLYAYGMALLNDGEDIAENPEFYLPP